MGFASITRQNLQTIYFVKLTILYNIQWYVSHIQKWYQNDVINIPNDSFWGFCINKAHLIFKTKMTIRNSQIFLIVINIFYLICYKCSKLKPHLVKSYLILLKRWTCLTHLYGLRLEWRPLFGYSNLKCTQQWKWIVFLN